MIQDELFAGECESGENIWQDEWVGMPDYDNTKQPEPKIVAKFKFASAEDFEAFKSKVREFVYDGEKVFDGQQLICEKQAWYPRKQKASAYIYESNDEGYKMPRFPIYIVSKGRWGRNPTSKVLDAMGIPFFMIVEAQEYKKYLRLGRGEVLVLPKRYKDEYDTYWKDEDERTGPGPARNFAWDHSIQNGHKWHWVMDDNIESFERFNDNQKVRVCDGSGFFMCEDFVLRYENIAQAGPQYANFMPSSDFRPPIKLNTRIYSCLLIRNDIPYRWRGRYNEDTDLSIRAMKDGWCTVQFNAFLQGKRATQTVKGGCDKEFYENEGTLNKSKMLEDMHPGIARVVWKFNRWHHHVDYRAFKWNRLSRKKGWNYSGVNNYGMEMKRND
jgi:hypothetical protein